MRTRRDWDADELILYADNDQPLYRQKDAFLANMHKKMKRGTYDPIQGRKLWLYYVDRAAHAYAKEFGGVWNKNFPRKVREEAAAEFEKRERGMIQRGEYSKYPPVSAYTEHDRARRVRRRVTTRRRRLR